MSAPPLPPPAAARDRAIVLVHGAWVGEWCWSPMLPLLHASGRPVHAVSLTGHGVRRHESGPHVTLGDHTADIVNAIEVADLVDVTLVAHSYGGRPATEAAALIARRLRAMVYVDAHAPIAPSTAASDDRRAIADANGGMLPFAGYGVGADLLGGDEGLAWFHERVMPQSYATFEAPSTGPLPAAAMTYVFCTGYEPTVFAGYAAAARADPAWEYVELDAPHFVMLSHPEELAAIVLAA
jgi:pimeloyl-ACP methyl ester carboxylesterase